MDQYLGSNKLATYLHPNSNGTFLELKSDSIKPPSPNPSTLLQQNPSLIDLRAFNSLYQRLVETAPSSSNTSSHKPFVTSSDLYIRMSPVSQIDYPNPSNGMFIPPSNPTTNINVDVTTSIKISSSLTSPPINLTSDSNSNFSTPISSPTVQHIPNSSLDLCMSKDLSDNSLSTSHRDDNDYTSNYKLSNFIIKIEQVSNPWTTNPSNERSIKDQKNSTSQKRATPLLRQLLTSPSNIQLNRSDITENNTPNITDNPNNKSPQYRPRHSYLQSSDTNITDSISGNNLNKPLKTSRQSSCRSPVFTRRPQQKLLDTIPLSLQPMALLSLDTNETILPSHNKPDNQLINHRQIIIPSNKRSLESSAPEQILIKRRYQKSLPTIITQTHYCVSYPPNIQRCVDCQTINPLDLSAHLAGCRFQHCRTLKYLGSEKYEIQGFTTVDKVKSQDIEHLLTPNSGGQPALNLFNANYIFKQIAKCFCLMFSYEEIERSTQNEKVIIWKRYMAGWREVCDECSTTLFNYHYMCKICGYMICIECSNEFSQMNTEKRKKLKRTCNHDNSYSLSEFIPWNILTKLRDNCINYLSKLNIDYSMKLYNSSRNENISIYIKSLKMKRSYDKRDVQKIWSTMDCNFDSNIEFYCHGRLPVFNEWNSENAKRFFQKVWSASCPVLVKKVHHNLSKTLWHPNAFKLHMIDHRETPALWDCETLTPILTNEIILTRFWDGFERLNVRLKDNEHGGRMRILKLKDWPTKKDFASVFPTRLHDLMNNIPFGDYTRRSYTYNGIGYHGGAFNIVERLPACVVKPDLGPKLYIAYSQLTNQESKKAGTTNLHIDVSDAVNVLVYVGIGGYGDDGSDKDEEIKQVEAEIFESNIDEVQLQRLRNGERPGALWHLFRSDDAKKIREYIGRTHRKSAGSDSIHDQTAYLEKEDLEKLREWSQVEAYPILQFLGDAIFIPSGAPHQVKNLHSCIKIAEDFVSPENLDRCLITTNEFRSLSKTHTNHADILQAKNILYYATRDALNSMTELNKTEILSESSTLGVLH